MIPWTQITRFGDITIMSVLALAIAVGLLLEGEKRLALWWSLLFIVSNGIVVLTKIAFIGWGIGIHAIHFGGFSGHAVRVATVVPVLLYLILQKAAPPVRTAGVAVGYALSVVLAVSRLAVHTHSVSEVVAGWLLGALGSIIFIGIAGPLQKQVFNSTRLAVILLALLPAPYVRPAPTQQWLTKVTLYFSGHDMPYHSRSWRKHHLPRVTPAES